MGKPGYRPVSRTAQPATGPKKKKREYKPSTTLGERVLALLRPHEKEMVKLYNKGMSGNSLNRWLFEKKGVELSITRVQLFLVLLEKEGKIVRRTQPGRKKGQRVKKAE